MKKETKVSNTLSLFLLIIFEDLLEIDRFRSVTQKKKGWDNIGYSVKTETEIKKSAYTRTKEGKKSLGRDLQTEPEVQIVVGRRRGSKAVSEQRCFHM